MHKTCTVTAQPFPKENGHKVPTLGDQKQEILMRKPRHLPELPVLVWASAKAWWSSPVPSQLS